jgi:drug/metabolite transporter (DMT)-like permease
MAIVLALLTATAFAAGTVLQQRGTLRAPAGADDSRFLVQILREPVWIAGALMQALGWTLQAAALDRGPLVVVQAITTLSLVIALPLGVKFTNQRVGRPEITAAIAVVVGIIVFLLAGTPAGGTSTPSAAEWWSAGLFTIVLLGALGAYGRSRDGATRAALFGGAAGVGFALQAAVTKVFVNELGHGVSALLHTWSTYVLILSAIAGFVLQQSALKTGVLAPAMAASNASTLVFSAVFGITVFGESLAEGGGRVAFAILGLALAVAGVVRLAAAQPGEAAATPPADDGFGDVGDVGTRSGT